MAIDDEPAFVDVFEDGSGECSGDGIPGMDGAVFQDEDGIGVQGYGDPGALALTAAQGLKGTVREGRNADKGQGLLHELPVMVRLQAEQPLVGCASGLGQGPHRQREFLRPV
jgi:hypothetical protein